MNFRRETMWALVLGAAGGEFLAVFAPGIDPYAVTAGEGVACGREDITDCCSAECMQSLAAYIVCDVECRTLFNDIERRAVTLQLALTGAESLDLFAVLIIDIIPCLCRLDIADGLSPQASEREDKDNEKQ